MIRNYIDNYKYSTVQSLEQYLTNQIITDNKNDFIQIDVPISQKDMEIDVDKFNESNQIIFIKNLSLLTDIFVSNKSIAGSMTFVYKILDSIVFFSKLADNYPFIMIRNKSSTKIQCKNVDMIYDFPIDKIFKKDLSNKKKFDIILESVGFLRWKVMGYEGNSIQYDNEIKISNGHDYNIINDNIDKNYIGTSFHSYLMNMFVLIIKQEQHKDKVLNLDNNDFNIKTYLIIDNDDMIIETDKMTEITKFHISPTQNPIKKSNKLTNMKFLFDTYKPSIRIPYQKLVNAKNKMNYCLVHSGDDYFFLKIIAKSDLILNDATLNDATLNDIFESSDIVLEGYRLRKVEADL